MIERQKKRGIQKEREIYEGKRVQYKKREIGRGDLAPFDSVSSSAVVCIAGINQRVGKSYKREGARERERMREGGDSLFCYSSS